MPVAAPPGRTGTPGLLAAALTACGAWAAWGLLLSPRLDVLGAFWFVCLLGFARWGRSPLLYAAAFLVVSYLEIVGTSLGTWAWQAADPTGLVADRQPAQRHRRWLRLVRRCRARPHPPAPAVAARQPPPTPAELGVERGQRVA